MIAWLGMYDMPHLHWANDTLWSAMRAALGFGPNTLNRAPDPWSVWQSPDLLLAQTCALPLRTKLRGKVQLVGTPDYGVSGCPPGYYCSVLIARHPSLGLCKSFVYNDRQSQSGWAAAQPYIKGLQILAPSGSHLASLRAVATGQACLAAIDAVTWAHVRKLDPKFAKLHELERTPPTPGLPLITSRTQDAKALTDAFACALETQRDAAAALAIRSLQHIPARDYCV